MTDDKLLASMLEALANLKHIEPEDFPNIDLYMDQVTTFMDERLRFSKRYPEDKILTKTMINNYAKNSLIPSPDKKRYSKDHMLILLLIYYFKNILSISDIQTILQPVTEKYFKGAPGHDLSYVYREIFSMEQDELSLLKKSLEDNARRCTDLFSEADPEDQPFLRRFALICLLSYEAYIKKFMIERIIDEMQEGREDEAEKSRGSKKQRRKKED